MPRPEDICPQPQRVPPQPTEPLVLPIMPSVVYCCDNPDQADQLLGGELAGYVYSRDGHPNATLLAEKCRQLHAAERALICGSGMAALSVALLALCEQGDHLVVGQVLYGRSLGLFTGEAARLGISCTPVDACDPQQVAAALTPRTRMVVVETIANPTMRVVDIAALAQICNERGVVLLVDNTFAGPTVCRPLELGASLVMESVTKIINGHSDVMLGLLCGHQRHWDRVARAFATWGFTPSPFDCWLASRGIGTLALRAERANANALKMALWLNLHPAVERVDYPGLKSHPEHELASRQLIGGYGNMLSFTLHGGQTAAEELIASRQIPFSPSLGDLATTLTHPSSTSHRGLTPADRESYGITPGMIRLSLGIESPDAIQAMLTAGLKGGTI